MISCVLAKPESLAASQFSFAGNKGQGFPRFGVSAPSSASTSLKQLVGVLVFACVFIIPVVFRVREVGSTSIDFQVMLKLGVWVAALALSIYLAQRWLFRLFNSEGYLLCSLLALMWFSCLYAPSPVYSLGSLLSITSTLLLFIMAGQVLGKQKLLLTTFYAMSLLCFMSLIVYVALPDVGRMMAYMDGREQLSWRLVGVMGTANGAGEVGSFAVLIFFFLRNFTSQPQTRWLYMLLALDVLTLLLTYSRTSIVAVVVAVSVAQYYRGTALQMALLFFGLAMLCLGAMVVDTDSLLAMLSRSGNADEILTGTGRTHIWHVAWQLIQDRPWFGYGFGSAGFILPQHAMEIGHAAPHAHNAYLNMWFTTGIFGMLLYIVFLVVLLAKAILTHDRLKLTLLAYLLATSMTESGFLRGPASSSLVMAALLLSIDGLQFRLRGFRLRA